MNPLPLLGLAFACTLLTAPAFGHGGGEASIEVGADKGVTEVAKDKSFKLSPEATKNFGIATTGFQAGNLALPKAAIVRTLKENHVFRVRDGFLKAISFEVVSKTDRTWTIASEELRTGDAVVVSGVGFLRIIAAQLGEANAEEAHDDGHEKDEHDHAHGESEDHHD